MIYSTVRHPLFKHHVYHVEILIRGFIFYPSDLIFLFFFFFINRFMSIISKTNNIPYTVSMASGYFFLGLSMAAVTFYLFRVLWLCSFHHMKNAFMQLIRDGIGRTCTKFYNSMELDYCTDLKRSNIKKIMGRYKLLIQKLRSTYAANKVLYAYNTLYMIWYTDIPCYIKGCDGNWAVNRWLNEILLLVIMVADEVGEEIWAEGNTFREWKQILIYSGNHNRYMAVTRK